MPRLITCCLPRIPVARLTLLTALAVSSPVSAGAQSAAPSATAPGNRPPPRDDWQRAPDIFDALGAREGSRIADVGAGEGWLSSRLAKRVGPTGRVFAVDVFEGALRPLQATIASQGLTNVEVILGEEDDPRLPYQSLDGVVIVNAYHEMVQRVAMLAGFKQALKPGGLLVIVDNPPADSTLPRQTQARSHQLSLVMAEDDLIGSGFEIVRRDPAFIARTVNGNEHRQWMLVARRGSK